MQNIIGICLNVPVCVFDTYSANGQGKWLQDITGQSVQQEMK